MLRKKYNIEKNTLFTVEQLGLISMDYFNNNLIVFNNVVSSILYQNMHLDFCQGCIFWYAP